MSVQNQVTYALSLKDLLSGKIHQANSAVNTFEGSLNTAAGKARNLGTQLLAAAGIGISLAGIFEFAKGAHEQFEQLEQSAAQIKAGLESTKGAAGLTFEELEQGAANASHHLKFTKGEIMDMQAILLTFPAVVKDKFADASTAIMDMSTRLHQDLKSSAIEVGKALQDPERGVTALHRAGVNFSDVQKHMIEHMVKTGHTAQAQAVILNELNTEFAGSAIAAAHADKQFQMHKGIEELRNKVGELADKLLVKLTPAINWVIEKFKNIITWVERHKQLLIPLITIVGGAAIAFTVMAGAIAAVNFMFSLTPFGWIVIAIGAITTAVIWAYNKFGVFRAVVWGVWEFLKSWANFLIMGPIKVIKSLGEMIEGVFTFSWKKIKAGAKDAAHAVFDGAKDLAVSFKRGYDEGMADFALTNVKDNTNSPVDLKLLSNKPPVTGGGDGQGTGTGKETSKANGNRPITINIKADTLGVKEFKLMTTTITEAPRKIKELIAETIVSAINDSMIIADR